MSPRHVLSWKPLYYQAFLPVVRCLAPGCRDWLLAILGRLISAFRTERRGEIFRAVRRADLALEAGWNQREVARNLASSLPRFAARDYLLDGLGDRAALGLFDVEGDEALQAALEAGRGAIIVGSHFGGHVAGLHWLYRRGVPLRVLVQRPNHVSRYLQAKFNEPGPHAQSTLFLKRDLSPCAATDRLLRTHAAIRDGMVIYFTGDIPWAGSNTRPGRLLGRETEFLSIWADVAALTKVPVFLSLCTHARGGRYRLSLESLGILRPGEEGLAVAQFLARLDAEIAANPTEAIAHLLWDHYNPSDSLTKPARKHRSKRSVPRPHFEPKTGGVTLADAYPPR